MRILHIHVINTIPTDDLHEDDTETAGTYEVAVEEGRSEEDTRWAALQAFHEKIGIEELDDFSIDVFDQHSMTFLREGEDDPEDDINYSYNGKLSDEVPIPAGMFRVIVIPTSEDQARFSAGKKPHNCLTREFGSANELQAYRDGIESLADLAEYEILHEDATSIQISYDDEDPDEFNFDIPAELSAFKIGLEDGDGFQAPLILDAMSAPNEFSRLRGMIPDSSIAEDESGEQESPRA